ncbi:NADP-dependent 3-hydroxy acid dehydrogenase YdfG [Oligella sp. MSHR50489EDL]|uniref:SDR family NAD(P)-dependent oxidoreductase n=1 Tax=Oligella sp. MSHR50489EDL TaxID=3139409 RepID=UPI003D81B851
MKKIVFVTGATSGFGKAISQKLIAEGHIVIACGRRAARLEAMRNKLGSNFHPLAFDIQSKEAVIEAINQLPSELREIDVLINNAGMAKGLAKAQAADLDDWDLMVSTNINGLLYVTHQILPGMVERNRGLIINMGSTAGSWPYEGANIYGATKAFVRQFSLNLRTDLAGTGVRVTNLEPGLCGGTEFSHVRFSGDEEKVKALYDKVDFITPEDIADIVSWLAAQPEHININSLELMPVAQTYGGLKVTRKS